MTREIKATKLEILEFFRERNLVWPYELRDRFGYSEKSVPKVLYRLRKVGLIINMSKVIGKCWELTEEGYRRLSYYGKY